ncbi:MAG: AAA family ATPase [Candidatus Fimenecus sp.]
MPKVIAIIGKICSGKSYYAKQLKDKEKAVILSTDEATLDLIKNEQGEFYNIFAERVNKYLRKKAVEIVNIGCNVILDWGFWTKTDRKELTDYFNDYGIDVEWHYIYIEQSRWEMLIEERNKRIKAGNGGSDFYLDEGLMKKLLSKFEEPTEEEIDVWIINE